ncbi:MAG TPA: sulfite exporter TauE/SafE family protein [Acidimicrobiales bacterium]|nr:sulfite exporter TauE/SafE family protein [Acidimicrobiales bacterium]
MSPLTALGITAAGLAAGAVNAVVGSGSLITFPTLLAAGYAPVLANVSNTVGLAPGSASAVIGYRRELEGQRSRALILGSLAFLGGLTGGILLLELPGSVFEKVVPVLIVIACTLISLQPRISRWLEASGDRHPHGGPRLYASVLATAVYGGYFGAAQGVILISLLTIFIDDDLQRLNGLKNVLALVANAVAAILFISFTHIAWLAAGLIALGSVLGGQFGALAGRRLSPRLLRIAIVVVGLVAAAVLFARYW